jgi:cobalt-zinc-cadmium efflux system outer membrane protein
MMRAELAARLPSAARPIAFVLFFSLAGCAPLRSPTEITLPQATTPVARLWTAPEVVANRRALTSSTDDRTLSADEVLAAAIAFNPRMKLARAQTALGAAGIEVARERMNPTLSLSPEHLIGAASGVSPWVLAVSIIWPMRTAGKRSLAIEQALAADDSASLTAAATVWSLREDARAAVCSVEFAAAHRALAEEEATLRADLVARFEKQSDAGIVSRYEVARARLERDAATQKLRQAEADLVASRHDIAALTGLPMSQVLARAPADVCVRADTLREPASAAELQSSGVGSRLDLRAKLAEFRGADAAWRAEVAKRYPDLSLGPGYMYDQGDRKLTFSLSFELPVHSHNAGGIARARADRDRLIAETEILQDSVAAAIDKALDQLVQARAQLESARSILRQSDALLERDVEREKSGELDRPAVLITRIATLAARVDELTAARAVADAVAMLESATQSTLAAPEFDSDIARAMLKAP